MEGGAAAGAISSSHAKHDEASWPTRPGTGSGRGKAIGMETTTTAGRGVLSAGQLALGCPAPMDGLLGFPQQQLSEDEEEGGAGLLCASAVAAGARNGAGTAAVVASVPKEPTFNENPEPVEELLTAVAPLPTASSSWSRRSVLCGRTTVAALKLVWSTGTATATLAGALLATLVFFWALYPVCTSCVRRPRNANSAALTTAGERGWSTLYINQLQVIGTHNSYHRHTYLPALRDYWDYNYPSLTAQLDAGIRHLELDIHYDWKTGRWFVFHLAVLDPMTSCNCLSACLAEIRQWSDAHPAHHILFIEIELKLTGDFLRLCGQKTPDADHAAFRAMQETVVGEFPASRILTPRQVRGDYETLTEAIRTASSFSRYSSSSSSSSDEEGDGGGGAGGSDSTGGTGEGLKGGWPLVDDTRGMVLFVIDYQSTNIVCRPAVRKALPEDDTVFFERTPVDDLNDTSLLAFSENISMSTMVRMVRSGVMVRDHIGDQEWETSSGSNNDEGEPRPAFIVDSPAQLMVWDDLKPVQHSGGSSSLTTQEGMEAVKDGLPSPLLCRTRCSSLVPEEQCVLEGFC
eukprot:g3194.t1